MSRDLAIIEHLEQWIGISLPELALANINGTVNGYALDGRKQVVGLNLYGMQKISNFSFIKDLEHLMALNLNFCKLTEFSFLNHLSQLTELYLGLNQITDISFLASLPDLTHLYLFDNRITDISILKYLKKLKWVDLRNNGLTQLPEAITQWPLDIKWKKGYSDGIFLDGNPFERPPSEIVAKGTEAVKAYFRSLVAEGERIALNEVKIQVVGDEGVGKTSLVKRLLGWDFMADEPSTPGIEIKQWDIRTGKEKIKVHLWDMGGKRIMHATHQLFLSRSSLYVVVLDGRKYKKEEYWFRQITCLGGGAPVIVLVNKIDENPGADVNRIFLKAKYPNILGFYRISCVTGEGIADFARGVTDALLDLGTIHTTWGKRWFSVKTRLENMPEDFISYDQYKAICGEEQIEGETDRETLIHFLNDLGVVLHFKDLDMNAAHVLDTEWVTTAIYKIVNSRILAECCGLLELSRLDLILKQDHPSDFFYPRDKYKFIIDLMEKSELCFEVDNRNILIPDLLAIREPNFYFDYGTSLRFRVEYNFLPASIMPRFIVKVHGEIKERLLWRTGVVIEDKALECWAVVRVDEEARTIAIFIQGEKKRDYLTSILFNLREINKSFEALEWAEKIPMPDNPRFSVSYDHLVWLEHSGVASYAPDGARKEYIVSELLGTVDKDVYRQLLAHLKFEFLAMLKLKHQKRGFQFEKFLNRLFKLFDLISENVFRGGGVHIDGNFQLGNGFYLVRGKWQDDKTGEEDLVSFAHDVAHKATWTRGLFISLPGFTEDVNRVFSEGPAISIVGMDGRDLVYILERAFTLPEAIALKFKHAEETNECFAPLPELKKRYVD